jgi:hypothetical protein
MLVRNQKEEGDGQEKRGDGQDYRRSALILRRTAEPAPLNGAQPVQVALTVTEITQVFPLVAAAAAESP